MVHEACGASGAIQRIVNIPESLEHGYAGTHVLAYDGRRTFGEVRTLDEHWYFWCVLARVDVLRHVV